MKSFHFQLVAAGMSALAFVTLGSKQFLERNVVSILAAAGAYLTRYEGEVTAIVAEEHVRAVFHRQRTSDVGSGDVLELPEVSSRDGDRYRKVGY